VTRGAVLAVGAVALLAAGCGSSKSTRSRVDEYIRRVDAIQQHSATAFAHANTAYRRFSTGSLAPQDVSTVLGGAEATMRSARAQLAAVPAPPAAARLRGLLLQLFDLDAGLAAETTVLARYQPAATAALKPLTNVNRRLRADLRAGRSASSQARALGRYGISLRGVAAKLRALQPPPVLAATHGAELRRLEATGSLAGRLRGAIARKDSQSVARLLLRFQKLSGPQDHAQALANRAVRAYVRRFDAIGRAQSALQRERLRLDKALK
jgi:hypothetical protein